MANDKFFQRRKETSRDDTKRKQRTEKQKNRCLIVCEGRTTEVNYFKALYSSNTKSAKNVKVDVMPSKDGTDPMSVVHYARKQLKITSYDAVICVFDKERDAGNHEKFKQANEELERISKHHKKTTIIGAGSVPCFELWFLLHFDYSDCPFSCCDEVEQALKKKNGFEQYKKSDEDHYQKTRHKIQTAITNATRLYKEAEANNFDRPYTKVHLAVEHLKSLLET